MKRITIVDGHPDPSETRLNHALASRYAEAARAAGNEVRRIDVGRLQFPLLRTAEDFYAGTPPQGIRDAQRDIAWADHLVFFYPLWGGGMPALLKGFFEQTFRPGFAMDYDRNARRFPKQLLKGKSARIIVTMGMPAAIYRMFFRAYSLKSLKSSILGITGVAPVYDTLIGRIGDDIPEERRQALLDQISAIAEWDSARRERTGFTPERIALIACLAAAAGIVAGFAAVQKPRGEAARRAEEAPPETVTEFETYTTTIIT